jgi:hypothetical protein
MTVLVSVEINDGVVMAADSASSFASGMVYGHADKIVNLRRGLPIGAMVTGASGIGNESIDTLLKDLRRRFNGEDEAWKDWALDPARYTLARVAGPASYFLIRGEGRRLCWGGMDPSAAVRLLRGPAARRGLGDFAARPQLPGANAGARRAGFWHPVGPGIRSTESSDLWARNRFRGCGRR